MESEVPALDVDDFLEHYGVIGMRWGHRKSEDVPPRKAKTLPADDEESRRIRAERKKKLIIAGSVIALAVLAAGGTYAAIKYDQNIKLDLNSRLQEAHDIGWRKSEKLASKPVDLSRLKKEVIDPINPNYGKVGTKVNCMRCTFAYELRRRGYDVRSTLARSAFGEDEEQNEFGRHLATDKSNPFAPSKTGSFVTASETFNKSAAPYQKEKVKDLLGEKIIVQTGSAHYKTEALLKTLSSEPDGARGELGISRMFSGHSIAWENINGKPVLIDAQNGKIYDTKDKIRKMMDSVESVGYTRLDNKDLNLEFLERWITDAKS